MTFLNDMKAQMNRTRTQNGDFAYESSYCKNLDFYYKAAMTENKNELVSLFIDACAENFSTALKNLFYLRAIKEGQGRRSSFRVLLNKLCGLDEEVLMRLLPYVPKYGRWDDVVSVFSYAMGRGNESLMSKVADLIFIQLDKDYSDYKRGQKVSNLAKWLPSINSKNARVRRVALKLAGFFGFTEKQYRKLMAALRERIGIVETKLMRREYDFDYDSVTGKALLKYKQAFRRNDEERYTAWLDSLSKNNTRLQRKAEKLYPNEIVHTLRMDHRLADELWNSLDKTPLSAKILVIRDGSGSMSLNSGGLPKEVADALTIYLSERMEGEYRGKFITFSADSKLVEIPDYLQTLSDKVLYLQAYEKAENTNLNKVLEMILASARRNPKDIPDILLFITDNMFDAGTSISNNPWVAMDLNSEASLVDSFIERYEALGVKMPKLVFWNVSTANTTFPTIDMKNASFVSGYSKTVIQDIIAGKDLSAVGMMLRSLERFDFVDEVLAEFSGD